ncbi:MAG: hypothetical protein M3Z01_09265 [Thermoproteota archaeon]|nr:hypothetical protein [Thermoproteota archaeon]
MNLKEIIFEKIKDGVFASTFCSHCKRHIWPPNQYCKDCFKKTKLRKINNKGILLEMSYSHISNQENYFGIGDFSGIRIIGTISDKNIKINDLIAIYKIKVDNEKILLEFNKLDKKN